MESVQILCQEMDLQTACQLIGLSRSTYYYWQSGKKAGESCFRKPYTGRHVLSDNERQAVLGLMVSEEYMDKTPYLIFYSELDRGNYHCSIRTMYRLLQANEMVMERRRGHRRVVYAKPELLATGPNQVWSWDITRLKGPCKWMSYYLYVLLDIYSRYVVGWRVARRESSQLAKELIEVSCDRQGIVSDRGPAMISGTVAQLLDNLDVTKSLSRPSVSNDNPYSESHFKTLKYRPEFPDRFGSLPDSQGFCRHFFNWYNHDHYHSGLNYLPPATVHYGRSEPIIRNRQQVMNKAYQRFPERFKKGKPKISGQPNEVWINKPENKL